MSVAVVIVTAVCLVEETEAHIVIGFFRLFFLFFLLGCDSAGATSGRSGGCGRGERRWIGQVCLGHLCLLESVLRLDSDSQQVLESVGQRVRNRGHRGVADSQRDGGNVGDSQHEGLAEILIVMSRIAGS